jgi:hypothetical protein
MDRSYGSRALSGKPHSSRKQTSLYLFSELSESFTTRTSMDERVKKRRTQANLWTHAFSGERSEKRSSSSVSASLLKEKATLSRSGQFCKSQSRESVIHSCSRTLFRFFCFTLKSSRLPLCPCHRVRHSGFFRSREPENTTDM